MKLSVAGRSSVVGTSSRAIASVFSASTMGFRMREIGVFNTTSTAVSVALTRFTASTAVGALTTTVRWDPGINQTAPWTSSYAGHTGDGGVGVSTYIRYGSLGAAIGSGIIWTFGGEGVVVDAGTANGIGIVIPTGTGQTLDYYYDWEE